MSNQTGGIQTSFWCAPREDVIAAGRLFCMPSKSDKDKQSFQNKNKKPKQMKKIKKKKQGAIFENRGGFIAGDYKKPGPLG